MDTLPQETLDLVLAPLADFSDVDSKITLCNLRLTCKRLADAAAPHLFISIPLWISLKSLQRLGELSIHPVMQASNLFAR